MTLRRTIGGIGVLGAALGAALAASLSACEDTLAPEQGGALVGVWRTAREPTQPKGSVQTTWGIADDGRVQQRVVMYGAYASDGPDDVSADIRQYGRIGATATAFVVRLDSSVTRDTFYGANHREVQRYPSDVQRYPAHDSTHYEIVGDTLKLTYYSYPADAPVLTRSTMTRVR